MPKLSTSKRATPANAVGKPAFRKIAKRSNSEKRLAPKKQTSKKLDSGAKSSPARPGTKTARLIALLNRKEGATIGDLTKAMSWQPHSVRGAISGTLKKKLGLAVTSEKVEGRGRVYHIAAAGE